MADASAARTKAVFEFKSATLPLIAVILKTADLPLLASALEEQLADSPDFFEQEPVVIDLSQLPEHLGGGPPATIDFRALRDLLARYQTQPIALRGGSEAHNAAARAAGLSIATKMDSQVRGMTQASRNANDGISLIQTADGALSNIGDALQRIRELAVQGSNATNGTDEWKNIDTEVQELN